MKDLAIARHQNGITLNPGIEFLLDDTGEIMLFETAEDAIDYLKSLGLEHADWEFFYLVDLTRQKYRFLDGITWMTSKWDLPKGAA